VQRCEFNVNRDSVDDLGEFLYVGPVDNIADSESEPPPPPLLQTETFPSVDAPLSDYIAEPWGRDSQGFLEKNLQNNPYYPFVMREEYRYIQFGIKTKGMNTYYDNVLQEGNTTLRFPRFTNRAGVQKLVASMPDELALAEWDLHTLEDMR